MTARIPRPGWYEPEQAIVSRHVRAAAAGRYPDMLTATRKCVADGRYKAPLPAARRCYDDLVQRWQQAARRVKPPLR